MHRLYHWIYSPNFASAALFVSLLTLLAAGLHNVADGFADVKMSTSPIVHWASAIAIELGVIAIGLTIAVRARSGTQNFRLYAGILLFVAASVFANYDASLESLTGGRITWQAIQGLDAWTLAKAALLGGAIPLMVLLVIEALRELAGERVDQGPAGLSPSLPSVSNGSGATDQLEDETTVSGAANGYRDEERGSPELMRQIMLDEPEIAATELARRLNIGRATVYRWRDDLGIERQQGAWIVP